MKNNNNVTNIVYLNHISIKLEREKSIFITDNLNNNNELFTKNKLQNKKF